MNSSRIMKWALIVLVWCAGITHAQVGSVSPGKLSASHAAFENQCNRCHVPFGGIPQATCLGCHTALADAMAKGIGYHPSVKTQACTTCHKEHRGRDAAVSPPPPAGFDHRTAAFHADGKHQTLACDRCHPQVGASRRWVGIPVKCEGCHADRHKGSFGSACAKCHTSSGWAPTIRNEKNHVTPIAGGHANLKCQDCHKAGLHLAPQQSCSLCHAEKHGGTKVECSTCHTVMGWKQVTYTHDFCPCKLPGKHQTAPCLACHPAFKFNPTPFDCASCHDKERKHEPLGACSQCHSALSWKTKAFDHNRTAVAFSLTGKHLLLGCENCHTEKGKFRLPKHECQSCHAVAKHGEFGACAKCHTTAAWTPSSFDHATTRMPLTNAHAQVKCQDCHPRLVTAAFKPGACKLCHTDPHAGQFDATPKPGGDPTLIKTPTAPTHIVRAGRACIDCHTLDAWKPSTLSAMNHGEMGFALNGAHAKVACVGCHRGGQFAGAPHDCNQCHTDFRHHGRFGATCADCHGETSWTPVEDFDHARTGFPLDNAHGKLGCRKCHGNNGTKLVAVAAPTACQTCHAAPHGKQFGEVCTKCHSTKGFHDVPKFDHSTTAFPLELRHATLPCLQCHDAKEHPTINRACRTCHGDPHRGANSFECSDCHRADRWRIIRFDHDRTAYPLTGRHRVAPCSECHTNPNWTGVRGDCVTCHAFNRPRTQDHLTRVTCDDCHSTTSWRTTLLRRR